MEDGFTSATTMTGVNDGRLSVRLALSDSWPFSGEVCPGTDELRRSESSPDPAFLRSLDAFEASISLFFLCRTFSFLDCGESVDFADRGGDSSGPPPLASCSATASRTLPCQSTIELRFDETLIAGTTFATLDFVNVLVLPFVAAVLDLTRPGDVAILLLPFDAAVFDLGRPE